MSQDSLPTLDAAVLRLLKPLVRILLRYGVAFGAFSDLAKRVYVEVATTEFALSGRKQSGSRVSVLTGLSRKEVRRVRELDAPTEEASRRYNRATRVISGWVRDTRYQDATGAPASLPFDGDREPTFTSLVRRYSGDVPARAVLDELVRVGAVVASDSATWTLTTRAYVPTRGETDKLAILGTDVADLIATIDHNLRCAAGDAFFQRKVSYDNLPVEVAPDLRALTADRAQMLLEELDAWMSARDRDTAPSVRGTGRKRVSVGIYYHEEDLDPNA